LKTAGSDYLCFASFKSIINFSKNNGNRKLIKKKHNATAIPHPHPLRSEIVVPLAQANKLRQQFVDDIAIVNKETSEKPKAKIRNQ